MSQEIERKFLVQGDFKSHAYQSERIVQGYLSSVAERTVRIRVREEQGYITVKGQSNESGRSRYEWEKEIPVAEARELLLLCESGVIDKIRYSVKFENHLFEVDEFYGVHAGLILAEIELSTEDEAFESPSWLGQEVTGNPHYYNAVLSKQGDV